MLATVALALLAVIAAPGQEAARVAQGQLGAPYQYGAQGPGAFDCSGLTSFAWAGAGVKIPRTTAGQWQLPAVENPAPGDIALFTMGAGVDHAGIMLDGERMVHAGSAGVVEVNITDPFWQERLAGFRRPVEGPAGAAWAGAGKLRRSVERMPPGIAP